MRQSELAPADRLITMPEGLPTYTLGWEVVRWATEYLKHPNGDRAGQRWEFVRSQIKFLLWWYAVDQDGNWLYQHAVRRLSKGAGKSPFAALLALAEFTAPTRVDHFDPSVPGGVVGKPRDMPLVQIAATAESQTQNTMRMVRAFAPKGSKLANAFLLDPGKTKYFKAPEGTLEIITSSSTAAEGAEATFIVGDEALSLDTPVPTPNGWTTVGDITEGDTIYGTNGTCSVTHTTDVFVGRPCYKVTFEDGSEIIADAGHIWTASRTGRKLELKDLTTEQMFKQGGKFGVPKMRPVPGKEIPTPIDPYVLGLWLGDGSSRWAGLSCGNEDIDFVLSEVQKRGVPSAHIVKGGKDSTAHTISLRGNSDGVLNSKNGDTVRSGLVRLDLLKNKHIPVEYLRASKPQRLDLLRGLMDSDGCIESSKGSAVFVNKNHVLALGVAELVRTFGYSVNVRKYRDYRYEDYFIYKVTFRPDINNNPFLLPRKASKVRPPSHRTLRYIRSIESCDSTPVKCIEVDSSDHLFIAGEGWTATHNTEHWKSNNGGLEFSETLMGNLTKSGSRMVQTCNAWSPGTDSVAEEAYAGWLKQEEKILNGTFDGAKTLYDARIAKPDLDIWNKADLREQLEIVYGDCYWANIDAIVGRIHDPRAREDDSRRKYLNQPTGAEDAWLEQREWAAISKPDTIISDGDEIVMFLDGSKSRDATAIIGCRVSDGHIFNIGVWEPDRNDPDSVIPVNEVDAAVQMAFDRWKVLAFFSDVREWESYVHTTWPERYKEDLLIWATPSGKAPSPIAWDMRSHSFEFTRAAEACWAEIIEGKITHDGSSVVGRHITNARRKPNRWGLSIGKETPGSPNKIDAAVCVIGAHMVRRLLLASSEWQNRTAKANKGKKAGIVRGWN